jgi:hypothetical protein
MKENVLLANFVITEYEIRQDLGEFCSYFRRNNRLHQEIVSKESSALGRWTVVGPGCFWGVGTITNVVTIGELGYPLDLHII